MSRQYDLPLVTWISNGLNRHSLEATVTAVQHDQELPSGTTHPKNQKYLEKILREELVKQFSDHLQPMFQVITNAIDARPTGFEGEYHIKLKIGYSKFSCEDNGDGMNLADILRVLIIPFNSDKNGIDQIGWFGVGFLSTFNYCVKNPGKAKVNVDTQAGNERYKLTFYSTSNNVTDMHMTVEKKKPRKYACTKVSITRSQFGRRPSEYSIEVDPYEYIKRYVQDIPLYRARITAGRHTLNEDEKHPWHTAPVMLEIRGKKVSQTVGLKIENFEYERRENSYLTLTNQGIFVVKHGLRRGSVRVSFPSGVRVVEGRDEFKIDQNYHISVAGVFVALQDFLKGQEHTEPFIRAMGDFLPALASAFGMTTLTDIPHVRDICDSFIPGKSYVLTRQQHERYSLFFGEDIMQQTFIVLPESVQYWSELYEQAHNLTFKMLVPVETFDRSELYRRLDSGEYPNLHLLGREFDNQNAVKNRFIPTTNIHLVNIPAYGHSPVLLEDNRFTGVERILHINTAHPCMTRPYDPLISYCVLAEYYSQQGSSINDLRNEPVPDNIRERDLQEALRYIGTPYKKRSHPT
ncbi:MAG: hypothetical protein ABIJ21_06565 [Nanoarchaeota archaeon]